MRSHWVFCVIVEISTKVFSKSFLDESYDLEFFSDALTPADLLTDPADQPLFTQLADEEISNLRLEIPYDPENLLDPSAFDTFDGGDDIFLSNPTSGSFLAQTDHVEIHAGDPVMDYFLGTPTSDEVPHPEMDRCRGREGKIPLCCNGEQNGQIRTACDPGRFSHLC
jgi:hypothetical protein